MNIAQEFQDVRELNARLERIYGKDLISNRPKFRIVWGPVQTEKRYGRYNEFYGSIFLRETVGMLEVPKYNYLPDCWILEQLQYADNPELAERSSYEPVWSFLSKDNKSLPPIWPAVEIIMNALMNRGNQSARVTSKNEQEVMDAEDAKARKYFEDALDIDQNSQMQKVVW